MYLGFENKEKYRLWVGVDPAEVKTAEDCSTDAESFSKKLFKILFHKELKRPHQFCCTESEGKAAERKRWKAILSKLNAHVRYKRTRITK